MTKFELSQGKYILSQETVRKDCRSPLLISAAILFTIAVILAIPCILHLFDEEANRRFLIYLQYDIAMSADALQSWVLLRIIAYAAGFICPFLMAVGLWLMQASRKAGVNYFTKLVKCTRVFLWVVALGLAACFLFFAIRYIAANISYTGGFLFIFSMLMTELVFAALVVIIMVALIRAMSRTVYGTENIRYNFLLGQYESWGISGATSAMFILAGVAFAVLGIILRNYLPALYAFISTAVGSLLMGIWWERYKRRTSRRAYEASLLAKNTL